MSDAVVADRKAYPVSANVPDCEVSGAEGCRQGPSSQHEPRTLFKTKNRLLVIWGQAALSSIGYLQSSKHSAIPFVADGTLNREPYASSR
jgi:hypothetical protein